MNDTTFTINQKVKTPLGDGYVQGRYQDGGVLVRLPINKDIKVRSSITPKATISGLWVFPESVLNKKEA